MTEPASVSSGYVIATGVGIASFLPGIDGDALVGAFAGATLFVVTAARLPLWRRVVYLAVSVVAGYQGAAELIGRGLLESSGVAAFICSACAITVTLGLIERAKAMDLSSLFRRGGPPGA